MHGRPKSVCPQTQHKLKELAVGLGTDGACRLLKHGRLVCPLTRGPVFVIKEYAAILHGRAFKYLEVAHHVEFLLTFRLCVSPPYPGRYACLTRELQNAVGRAASVVAYDIDMSTIYSYDIGVRLLEKPLWNHSRALQHLLLIARHLVKLIDVYLGNLVLVGTFSRYHLHVFLKHIEGNTGHRSKFANNIVSHGHTSVKPLYCIGICNATKEHEEQQIYSFHKVRLVIDKKY